MLMLLSCFLRKGLTSLLQPITDGCRFMQLQLRGILMLLSCF
ncbi:hypothetical protein CKAH01_16349 [Colletotrichum kahawae]|uniref:Uncharacterized protein n=1 Tax=Colletotrichum kahawae TaxID=34407 RepID=A0AAD9YHT3_COLKA|nr:hypothetical protein CKAH01_16349 [Colletotrichum kahawae]